MTRASRTTLQPLEEQVQRHVAELLEREREAEECHRAADDWWSALDFQTALERRNEAA